MKNKNGSAPHNMILRNRLMIDINRIRNGEGQQLRTLHAADGRPGSYMHVDRYIDRYNIILRPIYVPIGLPLGVSWGVLWFKPIPNKSVPLVLA